MCSASGRAPIYSHLRSGYSVPGSHGMCRQGGHSTATDCRMRKASVQPGTKDPAGRAGLKPVLQGNALLPKKRPWIGQVTFHIRLRHVQTLPMAHILTCISLLHSWALRAPVSSLAPCTPPPSSTPSFGFSIPLVPDLALTQHPQGPWLPPGCAGKVSKEDRCSLPGFPLPNPSALSSVMGRAQLHPAPRAGDGSWAAVRGHESPST